MEAAGPPSWRFLLVAACVSILSVSLGIQFFESAWAALLLYQFGIVILHLARGRSRTPWRRLAAGGNAAALALGILFGLLGGVLLLALRLRLGLPPDLSERLFELGLGGWRWPLFVIYHATVNAALEELFWRGDLGTPSRGPHPVDGAFALYHLVVLAPFVTVGWLPVAFGVLAATAWFWRRLTQRAGGLRPALFSHMAADASVLAAVHAMAFGF